MNSERSIVEGGASAATCTCGDDLARNGGLTHNYACPLTRKCQHMVSKPNLLTGETTQVPCGSRFEPDLASHAFGCPCLPLCPHCGTSMDRRGVHHNGCPNRRNYSFEYPGNFRDDFLDGIRSLRRYHHEQFDRPNFQSFTRRLLNMMQVMPVIPPRNSVLLPSIINGDFEIEDECQCSICHDGFDSSHRVLKPSGCDHCFHENCLTPWIQNHSTCPNCRRETQTILQKN